MRTRLTSLSSVAALFGAALLFLLLPGCKPEYPKCDSDKDCKEKEFCVANKCQQCRNSDDCGAGFECQEGKCSAIAGYCSNASQCPAGQACINNRCAPCGSDRDCPSGLRCLAGRCAKAECSKDDDCPQDKDCVNGQCIAAAPKAPAGPPCQMASVYFGFDESSLNGEATGIVASNVDCLKKAPDRSVSLVGRADPRGTEEYNLALSDRRSQAVRDHLKRLGVDANRLRIVPRGALDARGTDDASWAKDRRVDFEWQ